MTNFGVSWLEGGTSVATISAACASAANSLRSQRSSGVRGRSFTAGSSAVGGCRRKVRKHLPSHSFNCWCSAPLAQRKKRKIEEIIQNEGTHSSIREAGNQAMLSNELDRVEPEHAEHLSWSVRPTKPPTSRLWTKEDRGAGVMGSPSRLDGVHARGPGPGATRSMFRRLPPRRPVRG